MEVLRAVACKRCEHWRVLVRWLLQVGVVVVVVVVFVFVVFVVVVVGGGVLVRWLLQVGVQTEGLICVAVEISN